MQDMWDHIDTHTYYNSIYTSLQTSSLIIVSNLVLNSRVQATDGEEITTQALNGVALQLLDLYRPPFQLLLLAWLLSYIINRWMPIEMFLQRNLRLSSRQLMMSLKHDLTRGSPKAQHHISSSPWSTAQPSIKLYSNTQSRQFSISAIMSQSESNKAVQVSNLYDVKDRVSITTPHHHPSSLLIKSRFASSLVEEVESAWCAPKPSQVHNPSTSHDTPLNIHNT